MMAFFTRLLADWGTAAAPALSPNMNYPIDEELIADDRIQLFHPTKPGDILDGRYRVVCKLGFGSHSVVWLAENLGVRDGRGPPGRKYVGIKIATTDADAHVELDWLKKINEADPSHEGREHIRVLLDDFKLQGPEGTHSCLVFEAMAQSLPRYQGKMPGGKLPLGNFKGQVYALLQALDFLHSQCNIIHTNLRDDSLLMTNVSDTVLQDFVTTQQKEPQAKHIRSDGREVYLAHQDFSHLPNSEALAKICDFHIAYSGGDEKGEKIWPIQTHRYRAPEVILGCPWSHSVDIWNLGVMMWDMLENSSLFGQPDESAQYDAHVHLAQMVTVLGPVPHKLVEREQAYRDVEGVTEVYNSSEQGFRNVNKFWGGPFFDDKGEVLKPGLVMEGLSLADTVMALDGHDKDQFINFASGMLAWLPEDRKSAQQLMEHPFFDSVREDQAMIAEAKLQ